MFKALLLPNYISEQPQFFRDAINFANYWKNTIICIVTFKGHRHPNLTVSSSCYKFSKNFKPRHGFISRYFSLIFGRIVADKIIFDLRKFYCKIPKGLWDILGQTWHEMKKLEKWGTFVTSVTHDRSENLCWKIFTYSLWYGKFTIQNSWMVLNVFIEKKFDKVCAKLQILCNTEVLIFTIFHHTIVI